MTPYSWAVVGAGPAGIAAVGRLIDHGVAPGGIAWIDPAFGAGDLGGKWRAVSSNTAVRLFVHYLNSSAAFKFSEAPPQQLRDLDPEQTCALGQIADPLVWITGHLRERVDDFETTAVSLSLRNRRWAIQTGEGDIAAKNVVLAVGAEPKTLSYPHLDEISVDVALDPARLAAEPLEGATVAVFGSSHSSMIALPNLLQRPVKRVINFYRSPLKYAVQFNNWVLHDDVGLKGAAARWARENIDGECPELLQRCWVSDPAFDRLVQECDRAVYTVGFQRRTAPATAQWGPLDYNPNNGILAPGLFGLGIAFPQYAPDPFGYGQYRVGLAKFMDYLNEVLPLWLTYGP